MIMSLCLEILTTPSSPGTAKYVWCHVPPDIHTPSLVSLLNAAVDELPKVRPRLGQTPFRRPVP